MAEHDPESVEYMARLICVGMGLDPDKHAEVFDGLFWQGFKEHAIRALDWMQSQQPVPKVTTREPIQQMRDECPYGVSKEWAAMHDAAPMTPKTSAQC